MSCARCAWDTAGPRCPLLPSRLWPSAAEGARKAALYSVQFEKLDYSFRVRLGDFVGLHALLALKCLLIVRSDVSEIREISYEALGSSSS